MDWIILVAMVLAVVAGVFLLKRKSEPFYKLLREYYVLFILGVLTSVLLYVAYFANGQSQGGYVAALSCFFGVLVSCVIGRVLLLRSQLDRKNIVGKTLLATGLSIFGLLLVYGFFSIWNSASAVPGLLFGYAFGVALIGLLTSARLGLSAVTQREVQVARLIEFSSIFTVILCAALALGVSLWPLRAAGILLIATLITLALSRDYFSLRSALLSCVLAAIGVMVFGWAGRWSVIVGIAGFFVLVLLGLYYSSNRYRVVRAVSRLSKEVPYASVWAFEGVFACVILAVVLILLSYSLAVRSAISGWFGVALAGVGIIALGPYVLSRFDASGERIKGVFLAMASSLAVLLVFAVYQKELAKRAVVLINLAKIEVLLAVLLGFALVLFWAFLSARLAQSIQKFDGVESRLRNLSKRAVGSVILCFAGVVLVAGVLGAESLAGLIAGLFAGGFAFSLWAVFTGVAVGDEWRERSGIPSLVLAAAMLALLLAPLVV